jgi:hypothetical protein
MKSSKSHSLFLSLCLNTSIAEEKERMWRMKKEKQKEKGSVERER